MIGKGIFDYLDPDGRLVRVVNAASRVAKVCLEKMVCRHILGRTIAAAAFCALSSSFAQDGFTSFAPASGGVQIYVSSSLGSDSNSCTKPSKPCKTLDEAFKRVKKGQPDHVYLKRGDVWRGEKLRLKSGRSPERPAVVAYYGEHGPRPRIEHDENIIHEFDVAHVHLIGLHFDAYKLDPSRPEFAGGKKEHQANIVLLKDIQDVLLEDNVFDRVELVVQHLDGVRPRDVTLRRNIFTGAYVNTSSVHRNSRPSNMYAAGVDGLLIEENVFDRGGWNPEVKGAGGNMFNHNIYLQDSNDGRRIVLRNNIITRASSHGVQMRAGGVAEDNFFARNAIGLSIGYDKEPVAAGIKAHLLRNVVSEGESMIKGMDPCSVPEPRTLCTRALFGIDVVRHGEADFKLVNNVVSNRSEADSHKRIFDSLVSESFRIVPGRGKTEHEGSFSEVGSISYQWESMSEGVEKKYPAPGRTLADYNKFLGGERSFDAFMEKVLKRNLGEWDVRYSAKYINDFILAGFGLAGPGQLQSDVKAREAHR